VSELSPFVDSPETAGLFLDFDGTLSEIVPRFVDARPYAGVPALLDALAHRLGLVAIVSGRSASQLLEWLGPEIEIWGVHGAERTVDGRVVVSDAASAHAELMQLVKEEAEAALARLDLEGVLLEDKGVMLGLHFRTATDQARARVELDRLADDLSARHGLIRAGGRMTYELRPPIEFSKAAVVLDRTRALGLHAAAFIGDDRIDLPAFDALDQLVREGVHTLKVAVDSDEAPAPLLERADVVVRGPRGVVSLLKQLTGEGA
jgi:trehalose 6-phosphate phosphatase